MNIDRNKNIKNVICLVTEVQRRVLVLYLKIFDPVNRRQVEKVVEGVINTRPTDQERGMQ
jgi:hypothetical protein